jgi:hypothetical protein
MAARQGARRWAFVSGSTRMSCPEARASLATVRQAITYLGKRDRAPAAADCALKWASTMQLEPERLREPNLIRFFQEAADLHLRAYEKRRDANRPAEADKYLGMRSRCAGVS